MKSEIEEKEDYVPAVSLVDIFFKAKELERKGFDVIHFDAGEPDFAPPEQVVDATIRALKAGHGRYTESGGISEARKAVAESLNKKYHRDVSPNQVLVTAGGRLALYYAFLSLLENAKVGIISPDWPAYRDISNFLSLPIQYFKSTLEKGWEVDLDEIRRSDCNAIVLNYPNNPTGKILDQKTFEELVQIANDRGMTIISDEVYSDYVLDTSKRFKSILEIPDTKSIFVTSLSKSYAMTGFRAAYIVSDPKTISRLIKINSMIVTSMPEFVQYGMIEALKCDDYVRDKVALIRRRRDVAARALKKYLDAEFYLSDGSMYMFPRLHAKKVAFNSEKFALQLLESQSVSVTPGTSFGSTFLDHIRITLLQSEARIEEGIERMSRLLS
ncbi:MAG TPA: pyridoxal phosphate-dependent aminotransferase [Nitrososphaerales archaeon]|nr:pyridoxal phosphate-dependent aminotransferase [Nitrososphaerales archaeon]